MKTTIQNGKVYNEQGEVAVLYSPGYGAGWSTWNNHDCLFTPEIVQLVLEEASREKIAAKAEEIFGDDFYCGSALDTLTVEWLKPGTLFRIDEYDGYETVEIRSREGWNIA